MDSYVPISHSTRAAVPTSYKYLLAIRPGVSIRTVCFTLFIKASRISINVLKIRRQNKPATTVPLCPNMSRLHITDKAFADNIM
jgi:hypothetical protein